MSERIFLAGATGAIGSALIPLLREAGYRNEKIVIQTNKRAHVPSYTVAVLAQAMMQSVGINAQIEVLEWATQLDRYN
eukprot:gene5119-6079_t